LAVVDRRVAQAGIRVAVAAVGQRDAVSGVAAAGDAGGGAARAVGRRHGADRLSLAGPGDRLARLRVGVARSLLRDAALEGAEAGGELRRILLRLAERLEHAVDRRAVVVPRALVGVEPGAAAALDRPVLIGRPAIAERPGHVDRAAAGGVDAGELVEAGALALAVAPGRRGSAIGLAGRLGAGGARIAAAAAATAAAAEVHALPGLRVALTRIVGGALAAAGT